ncbi:site-specific integrase [uncultured Dialister sp.]|uniref:tyrosine-type recombinase/integrase n=1 Tax=uncultured Dialister sp. TaxID=278064 RepID=UPI002671FA96|nr:site-specific integrase [uncultured Dialister sp.]
MPKGKRNTKGEGGCRKQKRKDGTIAYEFRITIEGHKYTKWCRTKTEGREWVRGLHNKVDIGRLERPNEITLGSYIAHWQDHMKDQVKPSTLKDYMAIVNTHLLPAFRTRKLKSITEIDLNTFFDRTLTDKKLAPNTKRNIRGVFSQIMDMARKEKIIGFNPIADIPPIKGADTNTRKALTIGQAQDLLRGAKAYYEKKKDYKSAHGSIYPFLLLCLHTGARLGELLALEWNDIDREHNTIAINKTYTKNNTVQTPKTTNGNREVTVPKEVVDMCLSLNDGVSPYVFHTKNGTHISQHNMERSLKAVIAFAHLPFNVLFHELRHTFATIAVSKGEPITNVSSILGHSKTSTTLDFYAHSTQEGMKETSDTVAKELGFIDGIE